MQLFSPVLTHSPSSFPSLRECGWPLCRKDLLSRSLGNTVREGELEVFRKELLDVWTSDKVALLNFDNFQDLPKVSRCFTRYLSEGSYTWIDRNLARWRAA